VATIDWEKLTRDASSAEVPPRVAESWNYRSKQEHLAAGGFSMLAHELADIGCDSRVMSLVTRAANDEVRHSELCARMWFALRGKTFIASRFQGTPNLPSYANEDPTTRAVLHAIEMCCLSETITSIAFTEMLSRTTHPVAHAVVQSLLTDEIDHGQVGWACVADHAARGFAAVEPHLPSIFGRVLRAGLKPAEINDASDDVSYERWAYLAPVTIASIYRHALDEVVLPGFAHFGIDTTGAMAALRRESWFAR
jgi:hypothetical protein